MSETQEDERPGKVIVAILTDGFENSSTDYSNDRIAKMITHQRDKYSWQFIFIAANRDAIATASNISISACDAFNFDATSESIAEMSKCLSYEVSKRRKR